MDVPYPEGYITKLAFYQTRERNNFNKIRTDNKKISDIGEGL